MSREKDFVCICFGYASRHEKAEWPKNETKWKSRTFRAPTGIERDEVFGRRREKNITSQLKKNLCCINLWKNLPSSI